MSNIVYELPTHGYHRWTSEQRSAIQQFLSHHNIDTSDVPIDGGNSIVVRVVADGSMELSTWVFERPLIPCPSCPSCARQKQITVPVRTALPLHPAAYIAEAVTVPDSQDHAEGER